MPVDIASPLPAVTPQDQSVYTVATGDSSAKITTFTIHLSQDTPPELLDAANIPPVLGYAPQE